MKKIYYYISLVILFSISFSQKLLIPMDHTQTDHLKAYGVAFLNLKKNMDVIKLINYKFMLKN